MVSINDVYQKVLALANKEQRGYITPQEFNLFADHAQKEIFEQYFYDLNQSMRNPGNNAGHSDIVTNLEEKISLFEKYDKVVRVQGGHGDVLLSELTDLYRIQMVRVDYKKTEGSFKVAEEIQLNELNKYGSSPLGIWSKKRPVYTRYSGNTSPNLLKVYPYPDPAYIRQHGISAADSSNSVTVDSVVYTGTTAQPDGKYFYITDDEYDLLVENMSANIGVQLGTGGANATILEKVNQFRNGLFVKSGYIRIWNDPLGGGIHGRWSELDGSGPDAAEGDWQVGDVILMPNRNYTHRDRVLISYIKKPSKPNWGYEIINEKALYKLENSNDFDLHDSEESELVYRILALAGLAIQKPELTQTAAALEVAKVQQEKQ